MSDTLVDFEAESQKRFRAGTAERRAQAADAHDALPAVCPDAHGETPPLFLQEGLRWMRERYTLTNIGTTPVVFDKRDKQLVPWKHPDFIKAMQRFLVGKGEGEGSVKLAEAYLKWRYADVRDRAAFLPGVLPENVPPGTFNLWPGWGVVPAPGDWSLLRSHIYWNICHGKLYRFVWFICWLAQIFQQPMVKLGTCVALRSVKGTGKSFLADELMALLPRNSFVAPDADQLFGRFNAPQATSVLTVIEEGFWAGNKAHESKFKHMITSNKIMMEYKGIDAVQIANYSRFLLLANAGWMVPASQDERRFTVFDVATHKLRDHAYFAAIEEQQQNGGREAMLYDLLNLRIPEVINLRDGYRTAELLGQVDHSRPLEIAWFLDVLERGGFERFNPDTRKYEIEAFDDVHGTFNRDDVRADLDRFAQRAHRQPLSGVWLGRFLHGAPIGAVDSKNAGFRHYQFGDLEPLRERCAAEWLTSEEAFTADNDRHHKPLDPVGAAAWQAWGYDGGPVPSGAGANGAAERVPEFYPS